MKGKRVKAFHVAIGHPKDKTRITVFIDTKDDLKKGALGSIRRQLKLSRYQVVQCLKVLYWPRWLLSRNFREKV